ncbi:MAG: hypothetical protein ACJAZR_002537, partial [Sediminicola sp.]
SLPLMSRLAIKNSKFNLWGFYPFSKVHFYCGF